VATSLGQAVQALGKFTDTPGQSLRRRAGALVCLPGCVALPPGLRALLAGRIEGTLGSVETVTGGIERAFSLLHRGQGIGEGILGHALPAAHVGQLPDRLAPFLCPVCHPTIIASGRGGGHQESSRRH
jgi:hypothetical protein